MDHDREGPGENGSSCHLNMRVMTGDEQGGIDYAASDGLAGCKRLDLVTRSAALAADQSWSSEWNALLWEPPASRGST